MFLLVAVYPKKVPAVVCRSVRIYYIYYLIRSNAADGQRTADG